MVEGRRGGADLLHQGAQLELLLSRGGSWQLLAQLQAGLSGHSFGKGIEVWIVAPNGV